MPRNSNRYPSKDKSKLKDGTNSNIKYNPQTEDSPKVWDYFLSQRKFDGIVWEESNIAVYNEVIKKKRD
jgi:hypothetical protein|tara:strand:+ start:65 stop:271 length:207 start_codon:yes stop_codon:yes gene_type:complete